MAQGLARLGEIPARTIRWAAFALFLVYAWPGYIGWDTQAHLVAVRTGVYTDAHPPAIAALWRVCEVFVHGPALMLLVQAITLFVGLAMLFARRARPRAAALATAAVFLFPPIAGVTALVVKDALMAGFLVLALAMLDHDRAAVRRLALVPLVAATAMRWNALAATFPLVIALFRWHDASRGVRRVAIAAVAWLGVTAAAFAVNQLLVNKPVHHWYDSQAYQDIAGTLEYVDELDDAAMRELLAGTPLVPTEHLHARFRAAYNAADYRQLVWGDARMFDSPTNEAGRTAIARAWRALVFGHTGAYLHYRWDNFRNLLRLDDPGSFAHVYVWFTVIAAPETIDQIDHDATGSRVQDVLRDGAIWVSNTPLYFPYLYLAACVPLVWLCRRKRLELALLASGLCYEAAWFFLDPTGDFRYSQWLVLCWAFAVASLVAARLAPTRSG